VSASASALASIYEYFCVFLSLFLPTYTTNIHSRKANHSQKTNSPSTIKGPITKQSQLTMSEIMGLRAQIVGMICPSKGVFCTLLTVVRKHQDSQVCLGSRSGLLQALLRQHRRCRTLDPRPVFPCRGSGAQVVGSPLLWLWRQPGGCLQRRTQEDGC